MEFRIPCPADASAVENMIRSKCQHYGYPDAKFTVDAATNEFVLTLHDPDPLPSPPVRPHPGVAMEGMPTRPTC